MIGGGRCGHPAGLALATFGGLFLLQQQAELPLEIACRLEVLVDARVAEVPDLVGPLQRAERRRADHAGGDLGPLLADPRLDAVEHLVDLDVGHRPAGQGRADAGLELVAVPGLAGPVALDQDQTDILDALVGGEPPAACAAVAPPPDSLAGVGRAGIHHAVVVDTTPGAAHRQEPQDVVAARTLELAHGARQPSGTTSDAPTVRAPGWTPLVAAIWPTTSRGSSPGRTRCAIDHRVSPASTTTTCCGTC